METNSLAVTYRPNTTKDLVGQPRVRADVNGMLRRKKFPHTIMLSGPSGTGKTTTARMLARYLNCETYSACGKCPSCRMGNGHVDVTEINGADARGIEQTRSLIRSSRNRPRFNFRIIIIDECHQLTGPAMEALLKPTEEPPPHTIWMLCTTEPYLLPATLLGRCYNLIFKRIEPEDIVKRLVTITRREKIDPRKIGKKSYQKIADLSYGQMRDAITLLDGLLNAAYNGKSVSPELVVKHFEKSELNIDVLSVPFLLSMLNGSARTSLKAIRQADDVRQLMSKSKWLIGVLLDDALGTLRYNPYQLTQFKKQAAEHGVEYDEQDLSEVMGVITDTEVTMNSAHVNGSDLLVSRVGRYMRSNFE
jgi:DNA polymerase III subunit gamma/tau